MIKNKTIYIMLMLVILLTSTAAYADSYYSMGSKSWNDFSVSGRVYYSSNTNYAITTKKMRLTITNNYGADVDYFNYRVRYGTNNYTTNTEENSYDDGVPAISAGTTDYYTRLQSNTTHSKSVQLEIGASKGSNHWLMTIAAFLSGQLSPTLY